MDTKTIYNDYDFNLWVDRSGLLKEEAYFITKYLPNKNDTILEAGTGGGRIALALEDQGYSNVTAYDFVERFIEAAKVKNKLSTINFIVADATNLDLFSNNFYNNIVYLQQIISTIPYPLIETALLEANRILKDDGIAIFSFLNWNGRSYNTLVSTITNIFRFLRGDSISKQKLPWLKLGGKFNWKFLFSNQATTYWFLKEEIKTILEHAGFTILEIKTASELKGGSSEGMLYIVCQKKAKT